MFTAEINNQQLLVINKSGNETLTDLLTGISCGVEQIKNLLIVNLEANYPLLILMEI